MIGVTAPTLHVGMLFSSVCWYRDPHSLPWIEYLHSGASKIWYGVSSCNEAKLRDAMQELVPEFVKDSPIWLPSDSTMVDPSALAECGVPVCRVVQEPGQFVIIFPGAFSSSLCTGYLIGESVFFSRHHYLDRAKQCFDLLASCKEPAMFSLERLVCGVSTDARASLESHTRARPLLQAIVDKYVDMRNKLLQLGLKSEERIPLEGGTSGSNVPKHRGKKKPTRSMVPVQEEANMCSHCKQEQFLGLVVEEGSGTVLCLEHAVDKFSEHKEAIGLSKLLFRHTATELQNIVRQLADRIQSKIAKKSQAPACHSSKTVLGSPQHLGTSPPHPHPKGEGSSPTKNSPMSPQHSRNSIHHS